MSLPVIRRVLAAIAFFVLAGLPFAVSAGGDSTIIDVAVTGKGSVDISDRFLALRDPTGQLSLSNLLALPKDGNSFNALKVGEKPNFGYTADTYWLRLEVRNSGPGVEERLLEIPYPILSLIEFYQVTNGQVDATFKAGLAVPLSVRPIITRNFVFPVRLQGTATSEIYLKIRSDNALVVPAVLWRPAAYNSHLVADYAWQSVYFGIALAMLIFNFLIYVEFRERVYLRYVIYVVATTLTFAAQQGLAKQFLWPEATFWSNIALYVGYVIAMAMFYQLTREMLDLKVVAPRIDRIFNSVALSYLLLPVLFFFIFQPIVPAVSVSFALAGLSAAVVGAYCAHRRQRSAYFYLVAFLPLISGAIIVVLRSLQVLPLNDFTLNALQLGSALQMILLAFALADRFTQTRRERESALEQAERAGALAQAVAQAEQAREAAVAANHLKNDFLAMISHEVRTPLGGVIGMLRFGLKDPGLAAGTRSKLHVGLANAEILLQIINDILDYSKLEAGKMTLEVIDFDLPELIEDAKSILEDRAESKSLSLVAEVAPDLPVWCRADPTRLRQVLINLVGNAIKFTETGEVRLCVSREGERLLFDVHDSGIGISADAIPRLFQKFEQASADTSRKFGGTGLGLAISKRIVESMGGDISVTSEPGVGSTFSFWLPLELGSAPEVEAEDTQAAHSHRLDILCAEDGATNQIIIRELIEGMGHTIEIAEDGQAGRRPGPGPPPPPPARTRRHGAQCWTAACRA
ncbi:MAG: hypothetical protein IPH08_01110 [Rhodocyclaceae bacterium]|nr:hypothetical protein [Rhodocyclaceae bacterium]